MPDPERPTPSTEEQEAERILKEVERDSESIIFGGLPSPESESAPDEPDDATSLWGRRIGRWLAVICAIIIVVWLVLTLT